MGMLDGILGQVVGSVLGGALSGQGNNPIAAILGSVGADGPQGNTILAAVMTMLQQQGGLPGVLQKFQSNGLEQHAASWVGTGPNMALDPTQLHSVLGGDVVGGLASQIGLPAQQTGGLLAQLLPELINQFTPAGALPDNHADLLSEGLKLFRSMAR